MADKKDYKSDLVDEDGKPGTNNFRTLRTPEGWAEERRNRKQAIADFEARGTEGRSVGEHFKAGARALFEGTKYRENAIKDRTRDPINELYDRRKGKIKDED